MNFSGIKKNSHKMLCVLKNLSGTPRNYFNESKKIKKNKKKEWERDSPFGRFDVRHVSLPDVVHGDETGWLLLMRLPLEVLLLVML